jgi:hypothetical protein
MGVEKNLEHEIDKWTAKLKDVIGEMSADNEYFTKNIIAYMNDSAHFRKQGDLVRSFEAIVWAWAFYTIGKEIGEIK